MVGFCGALDQRNKKADFAMLKKMCGLHSGGCAFVKNEIGILCDKPIGSGEIQPLTIERNGALYTSAIISEMPIASTVFSARMLTEGYIDEGESFFGCLDFPYVFALYDGHHGELMLGNGEKSDRFIFFSGRDDVLYFSSSLRAMIRLYGGCVRINRDALCRYILGEMQTPPENLFCDIGIIYPKQMLVATQFGRDVIPIKRVECSAPESVKKANTYVENSQHQMCNEDMRKILSEKLFRLDIPDFDLPICKMRELKRMEKQIDKILAQYEASPCLARFAETGVSLDIIEEQRSISVRIKQKAMLAETFMWFDTFNFVII